MKAFFWTANTILAALNVGLFVFWWSLVEKERLAAPCEQQEVLLSNVSLQISILEATMAVLALALGVMAIMGYQSIRDAAIAKAESVVQAYIGGRQTTDAIRSTAVSQEVRGATPDKFEEEEAV